MVALSATMDGVTGMACTGSLLWPLPWPLEISDDETGPQVRQSCKDRGGHKTCAKRSGSAYSGPGGSATFSK